MAQNWDYAELSKAAKAAGGPEKYVEKITPHYRIYSSGEEPLLFMIIFLHRP